MNYEAIAKEVLKYSPIVAGALGSPIASVITSLLCNAFGVTADVLPAAISSNPNASATIKQFELEHAEAMATINSNNYAADIDNQKDARVVSNKPKDGKSFLILAGISVIFILGFFVFFGMMLTKVFPDASDAHLVFDILSNSTMLILSFWFGSCHGNK